MVDHYTIRTESSTRESWNWMHCLTPDQVTSEVQTAGSGPPAYYGDVTGSPYEPGLPSFATLTVRE